MALSLLTNVASLAAQRNVNSTQTLLLRSVERLSSGRRINSASDDAAGLAVSSKLAAQIRALDQAQRNAGDAVSMTQTADGALGEVNGLLARMRELSVQAANGGTLAPSDRAALNTEYSALSAEVGRIAAVASYNGQSLLDGSLSGGAASSFQVGAFNTSNDQINLTVNSATPSALGISGTAIDTVAGAQAAMGAIDTAIATVASNRAGIGATQSRLATVIDNLAQTSINFQSAQSRILDTDMAAETTNLARTQILMKAGLSMMAQANQSPSAALSLLGH